MSRPLLKLSAIMGLRSVKSFAWPIFVLLIIQQVIVASSSVFLVKFLSAVQAQEEWRTYLILLLTSVVLPYVPGFISLYLNQQWISASLQRLWHSSISLIKGQVAAAFDLHKKVSFSAEIKEIATLIDETSKFYVGYFPSVLNFIFNGIVISQLLGQEFLTAFLLGLLISSLQVVLVARVGKSMARSRQDAIGKVDVHFAKGWQTLALENKPYQDTFLSSFEAAKNIFQERNKKLALFENGSALLVFLLGFLPTLIVILKVSFSPEATAAGLVALGALLPRIFQIFTVSSNILIGAQQVFSLSGRWSSALERFAKTLQISSIEERIHTDKLGMEPVSFGRWRVTGSNGAGKSSWMLKTKKEIGQRSFYLPAKFEEFVENGFEAGLSTGQKKLLEMRKILEDLALYDCVLLDEWDANLDDEATAEASRIIDLIAQSAVVYESRH